VRSSENVSISVSSKSESTACGWRESRHEVLESCLRSSDHFY
jgi:hypothetical protein